MGMIRYLIYSLSLLLCASVAWADCNGSADVAVPETLEKSISKPSMQVATVDMNAPKVVSPISSEKMKKTTKVTQETNLEAHAEANDCTGISMDELVQRLKESKAIGFFTKLAIRADVLDFKQYVDDLKKKRALDMEMPKVHESFNGLVLKIMALLEEDPDLSEKIYTARASILKSLLEVKS